MNAAQASTALAARDHLRRTLAVYGDAPDSRHVLTATYDSRAGSWTGITFGDLRAVLAALDTEAANDNGKTEQPQPDVHPGQVWADNDPRSAGRTFRVIAVTAGGRAQCVVLTPPNAYPATRTGHSVSIAATRLKPTARGYRLISDGPGTAATVQSPGCAQRCMAPFGEHHADCDTPGATA